MSENSLSVSGKGSTCVSSPFPSMSAIVFSTAPLSDAICDYLSRYLSDLIMGVPAGINHEICRQDRQLPIRLFGSEPTPLQSLHHGRELYKQDTSRRNGRRGRLPPDRAHP